MKKSFLVWSTCIMFCQVAFAEEIKTKQEEFPKKEMLKQNKEIVKLSSEEISKTLPQKIDKYTTLMKVEGKENRLLYTFEINTGAKSDEAIQKEDRSRMKKAVTKGVCQSSWKFIEAQIDISYIYISALSKAELFRFDITKKECPIRER